MYTSLTCNTIIFISDTQKFNIKFNVKIMVKINVKL